MKTVLLTGGAGFIGSHLAETYLRLGYKVVVVDDLSTGRMENLNKISGMEHFYFHNVDIRNKTDMLRLFRSYNPHIVNHHAAQKSVANSVANPFLDIDVNIMGTLAILNAIKQYPIQNFIFISSGGALSKEITNNEKSKEHDLPQLQSPYAINKFAGEHYIRMYAKTLNFGYTILRYGNVYGPRQIVDGECGVVPIFLNDIIEGKQSTLMTYEDMPNGCTRDYVHVFDVVEANMIASEKITDDVFNIATGFEMGTLEVYNRLCEIHSRNKNIVIKGPRAGDIKRSVLDISKAKCVLGWEPKINVHDGLGKI